MWGILKTPDLRLARRDWRLPASIPLANRLPAAQTSEAGL
jgi:hypothetical protein